MSNSLKTIPPFFDHKVAPPPILPLLVSQTDVLFCLSQPLPLLTQESLEIVAPQKPGIMKKQRSIAHPYHSFTRASTPAQRTLRFQATSRDSSTELEGSDSGVIGRPPGTSGHPNSGGYNLRTALGDQVEYSRLKKFVHTLVSDHLDETKSYRNQKAYALKGIRDTTLDKFPQLQKFDDLWPVNDIIINRLKTTSRHHRQQAAKLEASREADGEEPDEVALVATRGGIKGGSGSGILKGGKAAGPFVRRTRSTIKT